MNADNYRYRKKLKYNSVGLFDVLGSRYFSMLDNVWLVEATVLLNGR